MRIRRTRREPLTKPQRRVYDLIVERMEATGRPPTMREIGTALGISSTNGVRYFLDVLEERGYIERDAGLSRGIRLTDGTPVFRNAPASHLLEIPVVGAIAAGAPLLAEENLDGSVRIDPAFFGPALGRAGGSAPFALRVKGDSMRDAGMLDGDMVLVRRGSEPHQGDIVVAFWDGEATVKRFERRRDEVVLHPENPRYTDIRIDPRHEDFRVLGVVTGVIRRVK